MMTGKMGDRDSPEEIRRVFKLFDDDETGKISFRNLKRVARELGENMTDEELQEMINKADLDGDGEVNEEVRPNPAALSPRRQPRPRPPPPAPLRPAPPPLPPSPPLAPPPTPAPPVPPPSATATGVPPHHDVQTLVQGGRQVSTPWTGQVAGPRRRRRVACPLRLPGRAGALEGGAGGGPRLSRGAAFAACVLYSSASSLRSAVCNRSLLTPKRAHTLCTSCAAHTTHTRHA